MASNSTKKRKKNSAAARARKRRQERRMALGFTAFLLVSLGAFASIALLNRNDDATEAPRVEVLAPVADASAQVLSITTAAPTTATAARALSEANATVVPTTAPTLSPTTEPTDEPTAEPTRAPVTIKLTAVGDCTLGGDYNTGYYKSFAGYYDSYGSDYFFEKVRDLFASDDLTVVNLEGPLTTSKDKRSGRKFNFKGAPEYVDILRNSSVEIANVANNHSLDFGESGFEETCRVLTDANIGASGFSQIYYTDVKGVTVCSIGLTQWAYSQEQMVKAVQMARPNCDLLIVSIHWGEEYKHEQNAQQISMGHAMIDAGADVVIGNHSHVYGAIEYYHGKYIVYSLGNFCFGGNRNPSDKDTAIFQEVFQIDADGRVADLGIDIIPARLSGSDKKNDFQPCVIEDDARARKLLNKILNVSSLHKEDGAVWMAGSRAAALLNGAES